MNAASDPEGAVLAEVTNAIVQIHSKYYGRGPTRAKSYMFDRYLVTVLEEVLTTVEETLVNCDRAELVRQVRIQFQEAVRENFVDAVQQAVGRRVATYHSQIVFDPDIVFEVFVLEE
jgi:uncharacterized protein YbcI